MPEQNPTSQWIPVSETNGPAQGNGSGWTPIQESGPQIPANYGFTPRNLVANAWQGAKDIASGTYQMAADLVRNPNWLWGKDSTFQKFVTDPAIAEEDKAAEAKQAGRTSEYLGHSAAAALPFFGPVAAKLGEQAGTGDIGGAAAKGAVYVGVPKAANAVGKALAPVLERSARTSMMKALGPAGKSEQLMARRTAPGMIQRGVEAWTRPGLEEQATDRVQSLGREIGSQEATVAQNQLQAQPVLNTLDRMESNLKIKGTNTWKPNTEAAQNEIKTLRDTVQKLGPQIDRQSLRSLKQTLDDAVFQGKGAITTLPERSQLAIQNHFANSLRRVLNADNPDIGALNREYAFWKRVKDITSSANVRTASSQGLSTMLRRGSLVGGSLATYELSHHPVLAVAVPALIEAMQSTAWRTAGAMAKARIASALSLGEFDTANELASGILANAGQSRSQQLRQAKSQAAQ